MLINMNEYKLLEIPIQADAYYYYCPKNQKIYEQMLTLKTGSLSDQAATVYPYSKITMTNSNYNIEGHEYTTKQLAKLAIDNKKKNEKLERIRLQETEKQQSKATKILNKILNTNGKRKGVQYLPEKRIKAYRARILINGKRKNIGYFKTREEAKEAYNNALKEKAEIIRNAI